jgi:hypothetical protein
MAGLAALACAVLCVLCGAVRAVPCEALDYPTRFRVNTARAISR